MTAEFGAKSTEAPVPTVLSSWPRPGTVHPQGIEAVVTQYVAAKNEHQMSMTRRFAFFFPFPLITPHLGLDNKRAESRARLGSARGPARERLAGGGKWRRWSLEVPPGGRGGWRRRRAQVEAGRGGREVEGTTVVTCASGGIGVWRAVWLRKQEASRNEVGKDDLAQRAKSSPPTPGCLAPDSCSRARQRRGATVRVWLVALRGARQAGQGAPRATLMLRGLELDSPHQTNHIDRARPLWLSRAALYRGAQLRGRASRAHTKGAVPFPAAFSSLSLGVDPSLSCLIRSPSLSLLRRSFSRHRAASVVVVVVTITMVGSSPIQAVLVAPGVKDRKVLEFNRGGALKDRDVASGLIRSVLASNPTQRSAFYVFDLAKVVDLFRSWRRALPGVRPCYAVKCNPDPSLLGALAALGAGFDCASRAEIEAVLALGAGVHPRRDIVYANPCKPEAHLEFAAEAGEEVAKVRRCHPGCELLLRIKGPDSGDARVDLGTKYGAHSGEVVPLLRAAQRAGVPVAGVSFHVGSGAANLDVYRGAVEDARKVFDAATDLGMPPMRVLDIGGGFVSGPRFDEAAAVINDALARHFGDLPCVEVIGEPGRYFAETAFTLAARVIGKRVRGEVREYWIDDGLYGSLNCVIMDHYVPTPRPLAGARPDERTYASTVFGPTCDSLDTVVRGYQLPEMSVGDWLVFDDMGAYTTGAGSNFNGFATSDIKIYVAYSS
ncbi:hypothetical protein HU200_033949 [Digitaria exilis]|uniref:ornithine decarboxylase n=1 Tax=Digitaria exilis TaxID=1010633 RepID=A0A835EMN0_9POAL|nr:hypothetical protein HU200_033949 [Digitaria exilis]